jgi:hypothetical protein
VKFITGVRSVLNIINSYSSNIFDWNIDKSTFNILNLFILKLIRLEINLYLKFLLKRFNVKILKQYAIFSLLAYLRDIDLI